jgi:hypothetical protein
MNERNRLEAAAQVAAEKHYPDRERGGCACGFCAYSVAHVLIESIREGWDTAGLGQQRTGINDKLTRERT